MKKIIRLNESELINIVKRIINESAINPIDKITELKNNIETILGYYTIKDGKIIDNKTNGEVSFESIKSLGPYYKTKIESVLVGTSEDKKDINSVNAIKNEIINGPFKSFLGDYNKIGFAKNQLEDFYTGVRCEYFRKGKDKTGKLLSIKNRPWCTK